MFSIIHTQNTKTYKCVFPEANSKEATRKDGLKIVLLIPSMEDLFHLGILQMWEDVFLKTIKS